MTEKKKTSVGAEVKTKKSTGIIPYSESNLQSAESLIAQAIEKNVPVETMEKLLAMRRELKAEWAKEEFDKAMANFQAECPIIEKKKRVSFNTTNYSYAPLEDIVEQVKNLLSKNGFSYTFDTKEAENAIKVICYAKHIAGHTEPSSLEIQIDQASKMNKTQQYGSANSYGKRYAFCNAFGILTGDEDNDAVSIKPEKMVIAEVQKDKSFRMPNAIPVMATPVVTKKSAISIINLIEMASEALDREKLEEIRKEFSLKKATYSDKDIVSIQAALIKARGKFPTEKVDTEVVATQILGGSDGK